MRLRFYNADLDHSTASSSGGDPLHPGRAATDDAFSLELAIATLAACDASVALLKAREIAMRDTPVGNVAFGDPELFPGRAMSLVECDTEVHNYSPLVEISSRNRGT